MNCNDVMNFACGRECYEVLTNWTLGINLGNWKDLRDLQETVQREREKERERERKRKRERERPSETPVSLSLVSICRL